MTDEGFQGHPMDEVEFKQAISNLAKGAAHFYRCLIEEDLDPNFAAMLTSEYLRAITGAAT